MAGSLGFARLAIMGCDEKGMQPFHYKDNVVVCNGELYGFRKVKEELEEGRLFIRF
jgi:asparagine synthase (glutamine-hydrolysing)